MLVYRLLHVQHGRLQVAPANVDIDPAGQASVFAAKHGRAVADGDVGHVAQQRSGAALGHKGQLAQLVERIAHFPRITHVDGKALQTLNCFAHVLAANGAGHHRLHVGDVQAKARCCVAIDGDVDVAPARQPLG